MIYEGRDAEVFASAPYLERLNHPTPWTAKSMASFRAMKRTVFRVVASQGDVDGGVMTAVELTPAPGRDQELRGWLTQAVRNAATLPRVVAAHLLEPDTGLSQVRTAEAALRSEPDRMAGWLVLVETINLEQAWTVQRELLAPPALHAAGAAPELFFGVHRLAFALARNVISL